MTNNMQSASQTDPMALTSSGLNWHIRNGEVERLPSLPLWLARPKASRIHTIEKGLQSARGLVAIFDSDPKKEERLKFDTLVVRVLKDWKALEGKYPDPNHKTDASQRVLKAGTSLSDICCYFPRHVNGDGLRLFMVMGWFEARVYEHFPGDVQRELNPKCKNHNAIQKRFGREIDKMRKEERVMEEQAALAVVEKTSSNHNSSGSIGNTGPIASTSRSDQIDENAQAAIYSDVDVVMNDFDREFLEMEQEGDLSFPF